MWYIVWTNIRESLPIVKVSQLYKVYEYPELLLILLWFNGLYYRSQGNVITVVWIGNFFN